MFLAMWNRLLLSGNEAVGLSALHHGFGIGTGYPGTPSTEILESLARFNEEEGGPIRTQWAPNEKVALEVGIGAAFAGARALVTMKHVGVNVAADPLFSVAYATSPGALVLVAADDPGMASSQNEQDSRRHAIAAGVPVLEPADSQQAYDYLGLGAELAERWHLPVMIRMTTRVCHCKSAVIPGPRTPPALRGHHQRDVEGRVMLPGYARIAHRRLRAKLAEMSRWAETAGVTQQISGSRGLGIICSGVTAHHVREAVPEASVLIVGMCHPAPTEAMRRFAESVDRCLVIEEGDPVLFETARAAGIRVEPRPEEFRFGELDVRRVEQLLWGDQSTEVEPPPCKAPELCKGCPHGSVFGVLRKHNLIVSGDIGCYTLAALPPTSGMDSVVCMGASIGIGLGLRHALADEDRRRVVSVIGDSTFVHSGIAGLIEMVYSPPDSGHVVIVLDNGTTAMTGQQEHPATGRSLKRTPTSRLSIEGVARAVGVQRVEVIDPVAEVQRFEATLLEMLHAGCTNVIVARRPCLLAAKRLHSAARGQGAAGQAALVHSAATTGAAASMEVQ